MEKNTINGDFPVPYFSHNQRVNLHFPMVFPCFSHIFLWFSYGFHIFLWISYGFPHFPMVLPMVCRPLTMQEVLDMLDPQRIAKFLHVEVPIRMAERIRWIREIRNWQEIPELVEIEDAHVHVLPDSQSYGKP